MEYLKGHIGDLPVQMIWEINHRKNMEKLLEEYCSKINCYYYHHITYNNYNYHNYNYYCYYYYLKIKFNELKINYRGIGVYGEKGTYHYVLGHNLIGIRCPQFIRPSKFCFSHFRDQISQIHVKTFFLLLSQRFY